MVSNLGNCSLKSWSTKSIASEYFYLIEPKSYSISDFSYLTAYNCILRPFNVLFIINMDKYLYEIIRLVEPFINMNEIVRPFNSFHHYWQSEPIFLKNGGLIHHWHIIIKTEPMSSTSTSDCISTFSINYLLSHFLLNIH